MTRRIASLLSAAFALAVPALTLLAAEDPHAAAGHEEVGAVPTVTQGLVTGITAIVDAKGHVQARLAPFTRDVLVGQAQGRSGLTPFARWGNGAFLALALAGLIGAFLLARRRRD